MPDDRGRVDGNDADHLDRRREDPRRDTPAAVPEQPIIVREDDRGDVGGTGDQHRAGSVVDDLRGDRTQDREAIAPRPWGAHDDKVGRPPLGLRNDHARGSAAKCLGLECDLRLPKRLRERLDFGLEPRRPRSRPRRASRLEDPPPWARHPARGRRGSDDPRRWSFRTRARARSEPGTRRRRNRTRSGFSTRSCIDDIVARRSCARSTCSKFVGGQYEFRGSISSDARTRRSLLPPRAARVRHEGCVYGDVIRNAKRKIGSGSPGWSDSAVSCGIL